MTVMLLCFMMGLQNALITKISNAEIRTTHITGMLTDIGIELGRLIYRDDSNEQRPPTLAANLVRLKLLATLVSAFFIGAVSGAFGFEYVGYVASLPLAIVLIALALAPALDDLSAMRRK